MRAKKKKFPFDLDEIEQAGTISYVDDTDTNDVRLNKNARIAAKKIVDKCKKIGQKRKRKVTRTYRKTSKKIKIWSSMKKYAIIAARKITEKYKKNEK